MGSSNPRLWLPVVGLLVAAAGRPVGLSAQEPGAPPARVTLEVRQVAGANVYLDLGTSGGMVSGDTVQV
ncbi:MAG: hypothetical protein P8188_10055, partial [Gemmatimonadota bacterium]